MPVRPDALAKMTVLDDAGQPVALGSLWRDRPAVLAFVRHFGCLLCREQTVQLHRRVDDLRAAGADLVVIGNGAPTFMVGFREATGYQGPLYTDPGLEVYAAAGFARGVLTVVSPRAALAALGALRGGFRQGRTQGDQLQQGGVLVIAPGDRLVWSHADRFAGDGATPDEILRALR